VVKTKKTTNNIKRPRSDYVELKNIPPCKFCNEKRFEYEPSGFCCGKEDHAMMYTDIIQALKVKEYLSFFCLALAIGTGEYEPSF
ncbi:hypothetical protein MTR67_020231, partial [Solanum verrucosum]